METRRGDLFRSLCPDPFFDAITSSLLQQGVWKEEIVAYKKSGESFPAFISISTINDGTDKITGTVTVIRDLSQQKKQEAELHSLASDLKIASEQLEEKLAGETKNDQLFKANLLNTIGQAIVAVDTNGVIYYWNKAAEKIYGWMEEEALGKISG
jgi:PAS domain-containing protein